MKLIFQSLFGLIVVFLVTAGVSIGVIAWLAYRSLPNYDSQFAHGAIQDTVTMTRDPAGVPHILGSSNADVMFALGYAHAQDRLWQMIVARRTVQGRLAEVFGAQDVPSDRLMRHLGLYQLARHSVDAQSEEALAMLTAYSAGVNARLERINSQSMGRGAPELLIHNIPLSPWRPVDSLALMKWLGFQSSRQAQSDIRYALASMRLSDPARLKDLFPSDPSETVIDLARYDAQFSGAEFAEATHDAISPVLFESTLGGASNVFAAAPKRTAQDKPILANDPHGFLSAPTPWYLARLNLEGGGIIGATVPGIPLVFSGRSEALAWGVTASYVDDQDILMEEITQREPLTLRRADRDVIVTERASIINVKGSDPITLTLPILPHGMASIPLDVHNVKNLTPKDHMPVLLSPVLEADDPSFSAFWDVMTARTVAGALTASQRHIAPSYNLMLADATTVAFRTIGAIPKRHANSLTQGRMPGLAWRDVNHWMGYEDPTAHPQRTSQDNEILVNTNNKLTTDSFPRHLSHNWGDTQRIRRFANTMEQREIHSRESFVEAQLDTVSYTARALLPLIAKDLWYSTPPAELGTQERARAHALELLASWDGNMNEHMPEPLIYAVWVNTLYRMMIQDELTTLAPLFTQVDPVFVERAFRDIEGAAIWCDIKQTSRTEDCATLSKRALDEAIIFLKEHYQNDLTALRWGDAHEAIHFNKTLGRTPVIKLFANLRQSVSGGPQTLNRTMGTGALSPDGYKTIHGATYRGIYDFSDPDSSLFVTSTGQSGHILSRHYDDLGQKWRRGEYIPMSLDVDLARAGGVGTTVITPLSRTEP